MRTLTTLDKAKILCATAAEAEEDSGNWYDTLWAGVPGYKPPEDTRSAEYKQWIKDTEEDWDALELDDDQIEQYAEQYL